MINPSLSPQSPSAHRQAGVVLIIALIMLVIISLLAAASVRNATSSEGINSNVRQTQLATQAAEIALRYCEDAAINLVNSGTATFTFIAPPATSTSTLAMSHIVTYTAPPATPTAVITGNWDTTSAGPLVLPIASVNLSGTSATFSRPPECMIQRANPAISEPYLSVLTITARGFGPEVSAADSSRTRPIGSEAWLQSTIELQ